MADDAADKPQNPSGDTTTMSAPEAVQEASTAPNDDIAAKLAAAKAAVAAAQAEAREQPAKASASGDAETADQTSAETAAEAQAQAKTEDKPKQSEQTPPPPSTSGSKKKSKKPMLPPQLAAGGAGWLATFADLMSLLMAFFVMLFAMSEVDKAKFEKMGESMTMALGSPAQIEKMMKKKAQMKELEELKKEMEKEKEKYKQQQQALKNEETTQDTEKLKAVLAEQIQQKEVEVEQKGKVIIIRMLQSGAFDSGSAKLKKDFIPVIKKMEESINGMKGDIIVSGHTDNVKVASELYRSNWELSAARAFSVIQALTQDKKLKENRLVLRGFGMTRPRVPNDTPQNRAKNRRVEVMIDQRPAPEKLKAKEGSETPKKPGQASLNKNQPKDKKLALAKAETAAQALEDIR